MSKIVEEFVKGLPGVIQEDLVYMAASPIEVAEIILRNEQELWALQDEVKNLNKQVVTLKAELQVRVTILNKKVKSMQTGGKRGPSKRSN